MCAQERKVASLAPGPSVPDPGDYSLAGLSDQEREEAVSRGGQIFLTNCTQLSELIRTGKLDFMLLLPVNTRFMISFRQVDLGRLTVPALATRGFGPLLAQGPACSLWQVSNCALSFGGAGGFFDVSPGSRARSCGCHMPTE